MAALHDSLSSVEQFCIIALWYCQVFCIKSTGQGYTCRRKFQRILLHTGKLLDSRLRMCQIIALRFAGDNEFVDLAKKAVDENLSSKQIKMAITKLERQIITGFR